MLWLNREIAVFSVIRAYEDGQAYIILKFSLKLFCQRLTRLFIYH